MLWLHHIGHRVKDMDSAVELFKMLGYYVEVEKMFDAVREQYLSFIVHEKTRERIELIMPLSEAEGKKESGPYHICYVSDDFEGDFKMLRENKGLPIQGGGMKSTLSDKGRIQFFYFRNIGIIELLEELNPVSLPADTMVP